MAFPSKDKCNCGLPIARVTSWTHENPGRKFEACKLYNPETNQRGCKYFRWVDEGIIDWQRDITNQLVAEKHLLKGEVAVLKNRVCCLESEKKRLMDESDKMRQKLKKKTSARVNVIEYLGVVVVVSGVVSFIMVKLSS